MLATPGVVAAAGPRGIIPLEIEGEQVAARIVGTVDRFPSVVGDAVVADRQTAATMLDTRSGGLGTTDELWLTVPAEQQAATAAALARAPFNELQVQSQAETLARLRADPLARGALFTLAGTAAVALLLALLGLLLGRRRRRAGRPRRAVRPRGAGRRAVDRPRAPAAARVARRRVRDSRRARCSARSCRRS